MANKMSNKYRDREVTSIIIENGGIIKFAKLMNTSTTQIYNWYENPRGMTINKAEELYNRFGISIEDWSE